ncbi:hypothetical protein ONZ45_g10543 [Pleurotus djamor]|nr:hypothetical protein ONZ45_g10543 [Pleurotus djamor]
MISYNILLLGATGFTGKLITKYLYSAHPNRHRSTVSETPRPEGTFTFAIDARSKARLDDLVECLDIDVNLVKSIVVDVWQPDDVELAVKAAKVHISSVGPYWRWGTPVVRACVKHAVYYVDLTVETVRIHEIIKKFHEPASKTRAVIPPSCRMDSIIGLLGIPLVLYPLWASFNSRARKLNVNVQYEWRNIHRNFHKPNATPRNGPSFAYDEIIQTHRWLSAVTMSLGLFVVSFLSLFVLACWLFKRLIPQPDEGPHLEEMRQGYLKVTNITTATSSSSTKPIVVKSEFKGYLRWRSRISPHLSNTSVMISESALSLILSPSGLPLLGCVGGVGPSHR